MTGPIQCSRRVGSPTPIFAVAPCSAATKSANTVCSTYTREHAEHFCPDSPNADRITPVAASCRFACRDTIAAFLPPISAMHGRGQRPCANVRVRCMPTS